jgi:inosine-uridine nucleoside N-ribohydrolase
VLGAVRHWDHVIEVEHNFGRDPAAAATTLRAFAAPLVVPLNVTLRTRLAPTQLRQLVDAAPVLEAPIAGFLELQGTFGVAPQERAVFLHDPLALLALVEPTVLDVADRRLAVEPDGRLVETDGGSPTRLAVGVDAPRAVELVLGLIGADVG